MSDLIILTVTVLLDLLFLIAAMTVLICFELSQILHLFIMPESMVVVAVT